jgi:hypothetical protein
MAAGGFGSDDAQPTNMLTNTDVTAVTSNSRNAATFLLSTIESTPDQT